MNTDIRFKEKENKLTNYHKNNEDLHFEPLFHMNNNMSFTQISKDLNLKTLQNNLKAIENNRNESESNESVVDCIEDNLFRSQSLVSQFYCQQMDKILHRVL